ncbi:hypothetical protein Sango_2973800 [Sesamum angolense]|uniref:Reverse transcriptase/retrotransposon-derived protein RNase H-like domain-containing protein n=1 Tax=Sesamum angolense TaxID=2727404 RepID=A0AAE1T4I8_9LAMI|nr:hypothetical protein Sango_2973800 [Sesamum angolense]
MIGNLKEYIEIPRIFKDFAKVMALYPIRIPKIGFVDIVIKDHLVLDRTLSSRTKFSSRMSFSKDKIMGYKGKEKELLKALTAQEIRVDNVNLRCTEGWKEIQVIFDITKNENFFPCDDLYHLHQPVIGRYEGMLEIASHENVTVWNSVSMGLINSDSFNEKSEEEIKNLKEALQELKTTDISDESRLSLENNKGLVQRNFSENPLSWWDKNKIETTLKDHIVEKIRNFSYVLMDKKHLQSFLGVVNFARIFIKDLAKYRKDFQPFFKEIESSKWKWEEIHRERVHELKQICNNLPKLVIPQDEDELVVYIDANDFMGSCAHEKDKNKGRAL